MRLLRATVIALASAGVSTAQSPAAIKEVAKLVEMRTHRDVTFPVFNYQGVFVLGDVSLQDYDEATRAVRQELRGSERIVEVVASQQVPVHENKKDLSVQTCIGMCGKGVKTADGRIVIMPGGDSGRIFIFERVSGKLQLSAVWNWVE